MLIIISDLHLGDGTTADSISSAAFRLFARRLTETARLASWRRDAGYRPIDSIDILLMGDILDPLHSTRWLDTMPGDPNYVRPWSDSNDPNYAPKLLEVTRAILDKNNDSMEILRMIAHGDKIQMAPMTSKGEPDMESAERIPLKVRLHYMVGNHDWYYHLKGTEFDKIRSEMIERMGLSNPASPFPFDPHESPELKELLERHKVFARHGDIYDKFNYDSEKGRDFGTVGDAFTMDVCNRFPIEVQKRYGDRLSPGIIDSLRKIANIRPVLVSPLWISGQIGQFADEQKIEKELKGVWDDIANQFLELKIVRDADKAFKFDMVDAMQLIIKLSGRVSFSTIEDVVGWVREKMWGNKHSFANFALSEPAFQNGKAQHIVYGHTHQYEVVPLGMNNALPPQSQIYFNSGTWHAYYDLAIQNPKEQKFVPYQALTYITFYASDEYDGRSFETWSGAYA